MDAVGVGVVAQPARLAPLGRLGRLERAAGIRTLGRRFRLARPHGLELARRGIERLRRSRRRCAQVVSVAFVVHA
jgi:hypothetical protein